MAPGPIPVPTGRGLSSKRMTEPATDPTTAPTAATNAAPTTFSARMLAGDNLLRWKVPVVAAGLGLSSVAVLSAATVAKDHNVWVFAIWVVLTVAAIACGAAVLLAIPRSRSTMGVRRAASFGAVVAVLCATLGLAVYSQTRVHDCPTTGTCTPQAPGSGQRPQLP